MFKTIWDKCHSNICPGDICSNIFGHNLFGAKFLATKFNWTKIGSNFFGKIFLGHKTSCGPKNFLDSEFCSTVIFFWRKSFFDQIFLQIQNFSRPGTFCHNQLNLGSSAKLRILQVQMMLQGGIFRKHPTHRPQPTYSYNF